MFGMGFTEILVIGIIAILFLGPDKLPETMVEIAKFLRNVKKTVTNAKSSIESELHVSDIRNEMDSYKRELTAASSELDRLTSVDALQSEITAIKKEANIDLNDAESAAPPPPPKPEVVTFKKKPTSPDTPVSEH